MTAIATFLSELLVGVVTGLIDLVLERVLTARPRSHGSSRWAGWHDRKALGRISAPTSAARDGIVLGFLGSQLLQSPAEDNVLLLGVQRSGKTSTVVVPTLLTWAGSVVATSTKEELVRLTAHHRTRLGPVYVYAPLDRDTAWIDELGLRAATWNPITSVGDCAAGAELADHFTASGKHGGDAHWYLSAANLISALAVLASERGQDVAFVLQALHRTAHSDYAELARDTGDPIAADILLAHALTPEREAGSIASTARSCLGLWADDRIRRSTAGGAHQLELDGFLADPSTLYLVAPAEEAERCRPLFSALVAALLRKATSRARAQGGVLSPRLLLALDEAANFARVPRLAGYASSGPGQGIQLLLCFHDLAQIETAYGREEMRTVWNNCRARLLLPGQGDLATLEQFSRAIGDETRTYEIKQGTGLKRSASEQRIGRPLCTPDDLRRIEQALLVYSSAPPARLRLRRWNQVEHFRRLVSAPTDQVHAPTTESPSNVVRRPRGTGGR